MYELEFTFEYQSVDARGVLYALDKLCPEIGLSTEDYSTADQVNKIENDGHLFLSGKLFTDIHGGSVANHNHDFLIIKSDGVNLSKLIDLIEFIIGELPVTQAFIHNYEYYFWQNAEDIRLYDSAGREHGHLPKTSNRLPPPLEQVIVDISNNPGRYSLNNGYREAISSPMWVSKSLVQNPDLLKQVCTVTELKDGSIFKAQTSYQTFDKAEGDQANTQNELREAVYGIRNTRS